MTAKKPEFDPSIGKFRILGAHEGVAQPGVEVGKPIAVEWYDRTVLSRHRRTSRVRGVKHPKVITETEEYHVTAGLLIGAGALLLGWEVGQSIAHGLAGLDPVNWVSDIQDWLDGTPATDNIAENTVGGWIQAHVVEALTGGGATPSTSSGGGITIPSSPGGGQSAPPGGTGVYGTPPVSVPFPIEPVLGQPIPAPIAGPGPVSSTGPTGQGVPVVGGTTGSTVATWNPI